MWPKKEYLFEKLLEDICPDMIEEIMKNFKESNYPDLENPNGKSFGEICSDPHSGELAIGIENVNRESEKSYIKRLGDIIFGVYSKEKPVIKLESWIMKN